MSLARLQIPYMTTAQRMAVVPNDKDLVFDTDLRKAFVGDGVTLGGVDIAGVSNGDMTKAVYDPDADGEIANAQLTSGVAIDDAISKKHANTNDPDVDQKAALAGTDGTPSASNKFVTNSDPRNEDARTPLSHGHYEADVAGLVTDLAAKETPSGAQAKVDSHASAFTHSDIALNTTARHSHSNKSVLDAIQEAFTTALKTSYDWLVTNITSTWKAIVDAQLPSSDEKAALAGTNGTPSSSNKYVTNSDSRNSNSRTPTAHNLGGAEHNADTLANLQSRVSDATLVALAGQLGGSGASPDVRGVRETSGPTLLVLGSVADGEYVIRSGATLIGGTPGGGSTPAWKGAIVACYGNGDPAKVLDCMFSDGVVSPTPTNISISVARCSFFKLDTAITVNKIRWYGVGATSGLYHVAVYRVSDGARMAVLDDFNTSSATWGSGAFSCTLAANVLYVVAVSVDTTGTTAGVLALSPSVAGTTGQITLPTAFPGNLDINMASPKVDPVGFAQFAVTSGVLPATMPSLANMAAWTGGMLAFFLDNNNA